MRGARRVWVLVGALLSCHRPAAVSPPDVEAPHDPAADLPIAAAVTCPRLARCLGIWDDVLALAKTDWGLPRLDGARGRLLDDAPASVWLIVDDDDRIVPVAELPVEDAEAFAASFVDDGKTVERVVDGGYRVDEGAVLDMGASVLVSPDWQVAVAVVDGLRPLVPAEPDLIASAWVLRDALPMWLYERLDEIVAERLSSAQAAGDQRAVNRLQFVTTMIVQSTELELRLRAEHDDWIVDAHLLPVDGTWMATRASANADPRCRLPGLLDDPKATVSLSFCEAQWAEPGALEAVRADLGQQLGKYADVVLGFYEPGFTVEAAAAFLYPLAGFAVLRMPDARATLTALSAGHVAARTGQFGDALRAHPMRTIDGRVEWRYDHTSDEGETTTWVASLADDVLIVTFGDDAPQRAASIAARLGSLPPIATPRFHADFRPGAITAKDEDAQRLLDLLEAELTLTTLETHHRAQLRINARLLHYLATMGRDTPAGVATESGA